MDRDFYVAPDLRVRVQGAGTLAVVTGPHDRETVTALPAAADLHQALREATAHAAVNTPRGWADCGYRDAPEGTVT